jgi:hypothetical protein
MGFAHPTFVLAPKTLHADKLSTSETRKPPPGCIGEGCLPGGWHEADAWRAPGVTPRTPYHHFSNTSEFRQAVNLSSLPCAAAHPPPPCGSSIFIERRHTLAFMAMAPDYYIEVFDTGARPYPWRWELRRRSKPMGVRLGAGGFQSRASAELAGSRALERFLDELSQEERRKQ